MVTFALISQSLARNILYYRSFFYLEHIYFLVHPSFASSCTSQVPLSTSLSLPHERGWSWQLLAGWWVLNSTFCRRAVELHRSLFSKLQTPQQQQPGNKVCPCLRRPRSLGLPAALDELSVARHHKQGRKLCCGLTITPKSAGNYKGKVCICHSWRKNCCFCWPNSWI